MVGRKALPNCRGWDIGQPAKTAVWTPLPAARTHFGGGAWGRDPAPRIEVMPGYSAVLVLPVFGMGEVVVLAQSNYTGQPLWCPVLDARASPNIISLRR
jgi:hypothetical protein